MGIMPVQGEGDRRVGQGNLRLGYRANSFATQPGGSSVRRWPVRGVPHWAEIPLSGHPLARAAQEEGIAHLEGARAGGCQLSGLLTTEQQALPGREA